jgi:GntR family transcriptional regulator, transcriptional repressor for pyruvate dehydrogenase complex
MSPVRAESLIVKAADEIRRYIDAREMMPGAPLPAETDLSTMLGISRNSLREALRILDSLGFIEKRAGKRAIVRSRLGLVRNVPNPKSVIEALPVAYEMRMLIERQCAELAAQRASREQVASLVRLLDMLDDAVTTTDFEAVSLIHLQFHDALVVAADNSLLAQFHSVVASAIAEHNVGPKSLKDRRLRLLHRAIVDAIGDRDSARAGAAVRKHFLANRPRVEFRVHTAERQDSIPVDHQQVSSSGSASERAGTPTNA